MAGIFCTIAAEKTLSSSGDDRYANGMLAGVLLIGKLRDLWTSRVVINEFQRQWDDQSVIKMMAMTQNS